MNSRIIVVDDDRDFLEVLGRKLTAFGYRNIRLEDDPLKVSADTENGVFFDLALIDMTMPEMDGIALLDQIKNASPGTECIMVTAVNQARVAVECIQKGAYDYLLKPVANDKLALTLRRALERKRLLDILNLDKPGILPALSNPEPFRPFVTRSPVVARLLREAELHAQSDVPVLITGESGTGKELLARAIHGASPRTGQPFTPINMASVTGSLFEGEFFGHIKGAFTGAEQNRMGYLEHTHRGTLFLDEISDLPLELQGKLLRVLQDGEFTKLGSTTPHRVDIRLIAATNEDLSQMMAQKKFRKDLYYRIRGGWLHLPPLRTREGDVPVLVQHFLNKEGRRRTGPAIDEAALRVLADYDYPGNVRELKTILQTAVNLAQGGPVTVACLPPQVKTRAASLAKDACRCAPEDGPIQPLAAMEKKHILKTYQHTGRNKSSTARLLGIGLNTLRRKLQSYGETD
ncbi:MAG: sigma-54 dependent transcriptional regulator [Pseudomonadota bacterium]